MFSIQGKTVELLRENIENAKARFHTYEMEAARPDSDFQVE
jgi:hypothetical protein